MKYISNGKYDKNMTRTLEEYADFFYDAMSHWGLTPMWCFLRIDQWGLKSLESYTPLWKWNKLTKELLLRHLISQEVQWRRHRC